MSEDNLEHDRWWIDKKLEDINRFEQRQLQIIGLVAIIVTLLAVQLSPDQGFGGLKALVWILIITVAMALIIIYLFFSWPRKVQKALDASIRVKPTAEVYGEYIKTLQESLSLKVKIMVISYFLIAIEIMLVILFLTGT
ncbi:MAG: hypothetical protein ACFFD4_30520 [Candidatus Odinarchaeota archaeon]